MTTREQAIRALRDECHRNAERTEELRTKMDPNRASQEGLRSALGAQTHAFGLVRDRLDAILAMPDEGLPWVSVAERMPTEADAYDGEVMWTDGTIGGMQPGPIEWANWMDYCAGYWLPLSAIPLPEEERT